MRWVSLFVLATFTTVACAQTLLDSRNTGDGVITFKALAEADEQGELILKYQCDGMPAPIEMPKDERLKTFTSTVYADEEMPNRVVVSPFLENLNGSGDAVFRLPECPEAGEVLRKTKFFYELDPRQSLTFTDSKVEFGAIAVPLRFRSGFSEDAAGTIAGKPSIGISVVAFRKIKRRYFYDGVSGNVTQLPSVGFGFYIGLSSETAEGNTLKNSTDGEKLIFPTATPALQLQFEGENFDFGIFFGYEWAFGTPGHESWTYDNSGWVGFGVGLDILK